MEVFVADPIRLITAALCGLVILLFLIIKAKFQPLIAILISALGIGLISGMPVSMIVDTVNKGMGETLKGITLLVGLGSMFGAILEISGGAERVALTMIRRFGEKRAPWALGITGMVVAIPVFFDAGLIILIPLAFSIARRANKSALYFVIPLLAGLAVGHAFIPPTPGPVLVANILGVDLGLVIGLGIVCGLFAMVFAGPVFGRFCGERFAVPVPEAYLNAPDYDEKKLPSFASVVAIIMIPLFLILINSVFQAIPSGSGIDRLRPVFTFLSTPFIALLLATVAMTMAAGIVASMPVVSGLSPLHLACLVMAIAGGSTAFSHFNDSGFWLVKSLCNLDEKTTFQTWTMMETIVGTTGFVVALIVSFLA